jgi:hypothetical protein
VFDHMLLSHLARAPLVGPEPTASHLVHTYMLRSSLATRVLCPGGKISSHSCRQVSIASSISGTQPCVV